MKALIYSDGTVSCCGDIEETSPKRFKVLNDPADIVEYTLSGFALDNDPIILDLDTCQFTVPSDITIHSKYKYDEELGFVCLE